MPTITSTTIPEVTSPAEQPLDLMTASDVDIAKRLDAFIQANQPEAADDLLRRIALARNHQNATILLLDKLGGNQ